MPVHTLKSEQKLGEHARLLEAREGGAPWRQWGPYLSERQWGTVREDYSEHGAPWDYFPHDHARSRAYRWGEDGLAGFCDDKQLLCFALSRLHLARQQMRAVIRCIAKSDDSRGAEHGGQVFVGGERGAKSGVAEPRGIA